MIWGRGRDLHEVSGCLPSHSEARLRALMVEMMEGGQRLTEGTVS